jgi:hypothetical protein
LHSESNRGLCRELAAVRHASSPKSQSIWEMAKRGTGINGITGGIGGSITK